MRRMISGDYEGDLKEGVREGTGKLTWSNGDYYYGEFKNGLRYCTCSPRFIVMQSDCVCFMSHLYIIIYIYIHLCRHGHGLFEEVNGRKYGNITDNW